MLGRIVSVLALATVVTVAVLPAAPPDDDDDDDRDDDDGDREDPRPPLPPLPDDGEPVGSDGLPVPPIPSPDDDDGGITFDDADESEPLNIVRATEASDFAEVREAIERTGGEPSTVYLGTSENWGGLDETMRIVLEMAAERSEVRVVLFDFERTRELFGLPDSYLAFAATAVGPEGVAYPEVFSADRRTAPALPRGRLQRLMRHAAEGLPTQVPPKRGPSGLSV